MALAPVTILFDGVCNFCNGVVQFIIRHNARSHFRFAALQSEARQQLPTPSALAQRGPQVPAACG